jgi:serine protease AprX
MRLLALLLLFVPFASNGQVAPEKYWVQFSDKDNTPYTIAQPEAFLSLRAIARREKQNIPIKERDLPVDPEYVGQVLATGAELLSVSKWMNAVTVRITDPLVLQQVLDLPFVVNHMPVGKQRSAAGEWKKGEVPADEKNAVQLSNDADYGEAFNQIDMLNGVQLHRQGLMGQGMLIAVLDGGFASADLLPVFDSLRQDGRIVATWDVVGRTTEVYGYSNHGTAVLSTMAAYLPGTMIGTAPKASYILIRTEDVASEFPIEEDYWITGAEYADSAGADIINSSLGYTTFDDPAYDHTYADMDGQTTHGAIGANMAAATGMLIVTSAGNSGNDPWRYISSPADADSALAIGAVNAIGEYASFSSIGPSADGRVKPNVCTQGAQAIVAGSLGSVGPSNGTSFAGPIMAGMAACIWQGSPDATNMEVYDAIERSAHLYSTPTAKLGHGIPNVVRARLLLSGYSPTDLNADELIEVHPNPFSNSIEGVFYNASQQDLEVRLVNTLGQTIRTSATNGCEGCIHPFSFDGLSSLPVGIYFVEVLAEDGKFHQTVIKAE